MKNLFLSKRSKLIIDILMIAMIVFMLAYKEPGTGLYWTSYHCMIGVFSLFLMTIHAWQHWPFVKALSRKNVIRKNKITALITVCFALILASVCLFSIGFNTLSLKFHNITGHLFALLVIIHLINKFKRLVSLFK